MRPTFSAGVLLAGFLTLGGSIACAQGQQPSPPRFQWSSTDLAMTYTTERSKITPSSNGSFWTQGGSVDAGITFYRGLGMAADITINHAAHIAPGVNLRETAVMAGPRYTFRLTTKHESRLFVEAFAGEVRGSDSIFPTAEGVGSKANAFSWQTGGGWDINVGKHIAIRAFEADYVRTYLPNNGTNTQGHVRLAVGVAYHIPNH